MSAHLFVFATAVERSSWNAAISSRVLPECVATSARTSSSWPIPVAAHRQFVFTIPKRLRIYFRFDRRLLGELCRAAWQVVRAGVRRGVQSA